MIVEMVLDPYESIEEYFEFERKFYLDTNLVPRGGSPSIVFQSYPVVQGEYSIRIRLMAHLPDNLILPNVVEAHLLRFLDSSELDFSAASVAVKGEMIRGTRYEREMDIDPDAARKLIVSSPCVIKTRTMLALGYNDLWTIDRFCGANYPLVIGEIERDEPVVNLKIPDFCISEVTDDRRFQNVSLSHAPFSSWRTQYVEEIDKSGPEFLNLAD